jgi:hypothetical protein
VGAGGLVYVHGGACVSACCECSGPIDPPPSARHGLGRWACASSCACARAAVGVRAYVCARASVGVPACVWACDICVHVHVCVCWREKGTGGGGCWCARVCAMRGYCSMRGVCVSQWVAACVCVRVCACVCVRVHSCVPCACVCKCDRRACAGERTRARLVVGVWGALAQAIARHCPPRIRACSVRSCGP